MSAELLVMANPEALLLIDRILRAGVRSHKVKVQVPGNQVPGVG